MKRIMIDVGKCDGCKNCSAACMQAHRIDYGDIFSLNLSDPKNESRNFILRDHTGRNVPIFCRHCEDPDCMTSCMSGALDKNPVTGLVKYDEKKCAACFMCVMNCPYGVPKPDRETRSKVIRCDFCEEEEKGPGCVRSCPTKAIFIEEVVPL